MPIDKKRKVLINRALQLLVLLGVGVFIYFKVIRKEVSFSLEVIYHSFDDHMLVWLLVVGLMLLNWWLEVKKWQKLCSPVINVPAREAVTGVLTGLSFSFITPHGWGDYFGRILALKNENRTTVIGGLFFGRISQLMITIIAGLYGLLIYFDTWPFLYFWYVTALVGVALVIGFNKTFFRIVKPYLYRFKKYIEVIRLYSAVDITKVLGYSLLRYLVFTTQFLLILMLLEVDLSFHILLAGVTWIFLVKSIIPSFNFISDLGIREVGSVMFFENYLPDVGPVITGTFVIWIINILLPSVIGTIFIFQLKPYK